MFAALLLAALSTDPPPSRFIDGGFRAEDSATTSDARTIAELSRLAVSANPKGHSLTGAADYRVRYASRLFDAFGRYSGPINTQFPRCHVGRTYEQLRQYDYRRPVPQNFSGDEHREFKAACYTMLKSPEPWTRDNAIRHLIVVADYSDAKPMLKLLREPGMDRQLVCMALGRVGTDEVVPALARELSGPAREQAEAALEFIGSAKAKEALGKAGKPLAVSRE